MGPKLGPSNIKVLVLDTRKNSSAESWKKGEGEAFEGVTSLLRN